MLLDSLITNIDRTVRNTNLLNWKKELWLIDHGASLYFHHAWHNWEAHAKRTFPAIKDHVLLAKSSLLKQAATEIKQQITPSLLQAIVDIIPEDWLTGTPTEVSPSEKKNGYLKYLSIRLSNLDLLTKEASDARTASI